MKAHNAGHGAKYTRSRRPVKLVYYETFATKQEAMRREWEIKQLRRAEKLDLINGNKNMLSHRSLRLNKCRLELIRSVMAEQFL